MKTRTTLIMIVLCLCTLLAAQAWAARSSDHAEDLPGYVDLDWIEIPRDADEVHDINLDIILLGMAAEAEEAGDPELAKALEMVKSIRVKAFSTDSGDPADYAALIKKAERRLEGDDWNRVVYVRTPDEFVSVNVLRYEGDLVGLMVIALEDQGEILFANVVGDLDLATLFRLAREMDDDDVDSIFEHLEQYGD